MQTHYALTTHFDHAEVWTDDTTQLLDLASASAAQSTLGGWRTSTRPVVLDGESALATQGRQAKLTFSRARESLTLTIEGRAPRGGPVRVYLNGTSIGDGTLPREGWGRFSVQASEADVEAGENELLIRAARSGALPGVRGRVGLLLRSVSIGASGPAPADPPPAPHVVQVEGSATRGVALPSGTRVGWGMHVPPSATLRGATRGPVTLRLVQDGGRVREVALDGEVRVPLDDEADAFVRMEFAAAEDAQLFGMSVEVPAPPRTATLRPKNVLLMLVDTLRADRLQPYRADTRVRTPGLAAFAQTASTFLHAHSQENWTKPSVATLLTSLMPWEHAATQDASVLPGSVEMLPEVLKEQGFHTGAFICNGFVSDRFGFDQGWDTYRNYIREGRRSKAEFVAADTLAWLDTHLARDGEEPFFLYVHTIDPHVPYRPPQQYLEMYGGGDYRGPIRPGRTAQILEDIKVGRMRATQRDRDYLEALYDGEISYHDVHFRAILDGLESRGLADDTMVVLTSDHGEEFWDHGSVGHGHSVYEELLHVPLFVRMPGQAPLRITQPIGLVDVMPTVLDALGVEGPAEMSGRSALPALRGQSGDIPRGTVSGFMENWRTFAMGRFKLVQRPGNRSAVYDLATDPGEQNDIASSRPLLLRWLRAEMGLMLAESQPETATRSRRHRPETTTIDAETEAQLRALGYLQ